MDKNKYKIQKELIPVINKLILKGYKINKTPFYTIHRYCFNIYNDMGYGLMILFAKKLSKTNWHCSMYKDYLIIFRDNMSSKSFEDDIQDLERCIDNIGPHNTIIA